MKVRQAMANDTESLLHMASVSDIHRLKKEMYRTRWTCRVTLGLTAGLLSLGALGVGDDDLRAVTVRAKKFILEDAKSERELGALEVQSGSGVLVLRGDGPHRRLELNGGSGGTGAECSGLFLRDATGSSRVTIEVGKGEEDAATMVLTDPFKKETGSYPARIEMGLRERRPGIYIYDGKGNEVVTLPPGARPGGK
jgi:hypothetical protein